MNIRRLIFAVCAAMLLSGITSIFSPGVVDAQICYGPTKKPYPCPTAQASGGNKKHSPTPLPPTSTPTLTATPLPSPTPTFTPTAIGPLVSSGSNNAAGSGQSGPRSDLGSSGRPALLSQPPTPLSLLVIGILCAILVIGFRLFHSLQTVIDSRAAGLGGHRTESVGENETVTINGKRTESVGGNETITIGGNRTESVSGNETVTIGGNRTESVGGDETITIGGDGSGKGN